MRFLFVYSDLTRKQPKYKDLLIERERERPIMNSLRADFNKNVAEQ